MRTEKWMTWMGLRPYKVSNGSVMPFPEQHVCSWTRRDFFQYALLNQGTKRKFMVKLTNSVESRLP